MTPELDYWLAELRRLEGAYARGKAVASKGRLRGRQVPHDLVLIWKKSFQAMDLRGDIAEAHRNIQTYALAELAKREGRG